MMCRQCHVEFDKSKQEKIKGHLGRGIYIMCPCCKKPYLVEAIDKGGNEHITLDNGQIVRKFPKRRK